MQDRAPKFAVVLSGCGVFDGSEIHEAVCTMLAISQSGCTYQCFAPNTWQARTIDHFTGSATAIAGDEDNRNVLAESARLARGNIKDLAEFKAKDYDAIVFPGGFGAALNWSDFAVKASDCDVNEEIRRALEESHKEGIVIGAMCIAPVVIAKVLGKNRVKVTVGNDKKVAAGLQKMGAIPEDKCATEACVDLDNKVVTTPCYMLANSLSEIYEGTRNLVDEMLEIMDY
ncbi:MAG: isoprenoid biosynthesis glyoxalase ElbB [Alphaproteobacteria bacterium]|nr:isoprenoid biosynthesis glyoxalase ElbB [Alphaproteobacteria bacterium]